MTRALPGLGLVGFWPRGSNGYDTALNNNLLQASVLIQSRADSYITEVPVSPADGDIHILSADPNKNSLAVRDAGEWVYLTPNKGWRVWVDAEGGYRNYNGTEWVPEEVTVAPSLSIDIDESVRLATVEADGNIALTGLYTLQGIAILDGNRILPAYQTDATKRVVHVARAGAWEIADRWNPGDTDKVNSAVIVPVEEGTSLGHNYQLITPDPVILGTTSLNWDPDAPPVVTSRFTTRNINSPTANLDLSYAKTWAYLTRPSNQVITLLPNGSAPHVVTEEIVLQNRNASGTKSLSWSSPVVVNGVTGGTIVFQSASDGLILKKFNTNQWSASRFLDPSFSLGTNSYADGILAAHVAAADPHTGYQKESEKGGANGYAGLDGSSKVPAAQLPIDTDNTLAANSDSLLASQKAVKAHVANAIATLDAEIFQGVIDCSTNPNFPAANKGYVYRVSVAGKIGGASGTTVEVNDRLACTLDGSAAGTLAAVGANWYITQANIDGQVTGPTSATDGRVAAFDGTSGKLIKELTSAELTALVNTFTSPLKGLVPASGGGTTNYLRADGSWAAPPGSGLSGATNAQAIAQSSNALAVTPANLAAVLGPGSDNTGGATITMGDGAYFKLITSTTAITGFVFTDDAVGREAWVEFNTVRVLTYNATSLITPGSANITTEVGDVALIRSLGSNNFRVMSYQRKSGKALYINSGAASDFWSNNTNPTIQALAIGQMWAAALPVTLTFAATIAVDMSTFINGELTMTGNGTLGQPTNTKVGQSGWIRIIQDGIGSRTLAFHSDWKFDGGVDPVLTLTAAAYDVLHYEVVAANHIVASLLKNAS